MYSEKLHLFEQKVSREFKEFYTCLVCVMMNWKETPSSDCKMRSAVCFLTIENNFRPKIDCHLNTDYGKENVVNLKNAQ